MKKKIALLLMCLLSVASILSGCTLFEKNLPKYYNTTVVSIEYPTGDVININKKELIIAFNNYGSTLVNQGSTVEEALDKTMTTLINQKILIHESKNKISLTNLDYNNLWEDTLSALETNLEEYYEDIYEKWDITQPTTSQIEDENAVIYKEYEPQAKVVLEDGVYKIVVIDKSEDENVDLIFDKTEVDLVVANIYDVMMSKTTTESQNEADKTTAKVYAEALKKYTRELVVIEQGQKLSTDAESVLKREIKRIYENNLDNLKIEKMQEYIVGTNNQKTITSEDVLNKYENMMLDSYFKYTLNNEQFEKDILSSFANVNYVPSDDYFFVSHILFKFSDEQQAKYNDLKTKKSQGTISPLYYNEQMEILKNQVMGSARNDKGVFEDEQKGASEILQKEIMPAMNNASNDQKAKVFADFIYKYNQDDGALNSEYLYIVGADKSKMVQAFTDEARKLDEKGEYGEVSDLVMTEYGVHILFYGGKVENKFEIADVDNFNLSNSDLYTMSTTLLNPMNNKTLFDKVYESITVSNNTSSVNMYLNVTKSDLTITKYKNAYKDLLK